MKEMSVCRDALRREPLVHMGQPIAAVPEDNASVCDFSQADMQTEYSPALDQEGPGP